MPCNVVAFAATLICLLLVSCHGASLISMDDKTGAFYSDQVTLQQIARHPEPLVLVSNFGDQGDGKSCTFRALAKYLNQDCTVAIGHTTGHTTIGANSCLVNNLLLLDFEGRNVDRTRDRRLAPLAAVTSSMFVVVMQGTIRQHQLDDIQFFAKPFSRSYFDMMQDEIPQQNGIHQLLAGQSQSLNATMSEIVPLVIVLRTARSLTLSNGTATNAAGFLAERIPPNHVLRNHFDPITLLVLPEVTLDEAALYLSDTSFHPELLPSYWEVIGQLAALVRRYENQTSGTMGADFAALVQHAVQILNTQQPLAVPNLMETFVWSLLNRKQEIILTEIRQNTTWMIRELQANVNSGYPDQEQLRKKYQTFQEQFRVGFPVYSKLVEPEMWQNILVRLENQFTETVDKALNRLLQFEMNESANATRMHLKATKDMRTIGERAVNHENDVAQVEDELNKIMNVFASGVPERVASRSSYLSQQGEMTRNIIVKLNERIALQIKIERDKKRETSAGSFTLCLGDVHVSNCQTCTSSHTYPLAKMYPELFNNAERYDNIMKLGIQAYYIDFKVNKWWCKHYIYEPALMNPDPNWPQVTIHELQESSCSHKVLWDPKLKEITFVLSEWGDNHPGHKTIEGIYLTVEVNELFDKRELAIIQGAQFSAEELFQQCMVLSRRDPSYRNLCREYTFRVKATRCPHRIFPSSAARYEEQWFFV